MKKGDIMSLIKMKLYKDDDIYYDMKDVNGTFLDDILKFEVENTNNEFNLSDYGCVFTRENNEFRFILNLIEETATFLLKETDTLLDVKVERCNFKRKKNEILIEYQLETDDCLNKIEIEIGE